MPQIPSRMEKLYGKSGRKRSVKPVLDLSQLSDVSLSVVKETAEQFARDQAARLAQSQGTTDRPRGPPSATITSEQHAKAHQQQKRKLEAVSDETPAAKREKPLFDVSEDEDDINDNASEAPSSSILGEASEKKLKACNKELKAKQGELYSMLKRTEKTLEDMEKLRDL